MEARVQTVAEDVQIELDEATVTKQVQAFREALRPFGLDRFMISDGPDRILTLADGRVLAEYRTMPMVVWYPEKLNELAAAGFDVVTYTKRYKSRPPDRMYYVRSVVEIGGNYGNQ